MRLREGQSIDIIDIVGDVARSIPQRCEIIVHGENGPQGMPCPPVNYIFGSSQYVRERIIELGNTNSGTIFKYPLVALFVPLTEERGYPDFKSKAKLHVLIAWATSRDLSNEERKRLSFDNVLKPMYEAFLAGLLADPRLEKPYGGLIPHRYSENYSYGRYGAYTSTGEKMSDPIDAINITELELKVKNINCIRR